MTQAITEYQRFAPGVQHSENLLLPNVPAEEPRPDSSEQTPFSQLDLH